MAPAKNSSPNPSDAGRLLMKGFRFLRFDEPLETEFRSEHRSRLRVWNRVAIMVSACTVLGFAILDHFVLSAEHSRITNMVRFGMHVPGGDPDALLHLEAVLRSLVRARHRVRGADVRHRHRHHGGVFARQRSAADWWAPAAGVVLLLFHDRPAAALGAAGEPHRVWRAGGRVHRGHACPRPRLPT